MPFIAFGDTDIGPTRSSNEDSYCLVPNLNLDIVADGMGGHAAGEVASKMAVEIIRDFMTSTQDLKTFTPPPGVSPDLPAIAQRLSAAGKLANQKIFELGHSESKYNGMGTTMVSFISNGNESFVAHAGDSRAYLIREGSIDQLTMDHSLIGEYLRLGRISSDDVNRHPLKHVITRALGTTEQVEIDVTPVSLRDGDFLLLCSDGLSNPLSDEDILTKVMESGKNIEEGCKKLIRLALDKGADDNITVILLHYSK